MSDISCYEHEDPAGSLHEEDGNDDEVPAVNYERPWVHNLGFAVGDAPVGSQSVEQAPLHGAVKSIAEQKDTNWNHKEAASKPSTDRPRAGSAGAHHEAGTVDDNSQEGPDNSVAEAMVTPKVKEALRPASAGATAIPRTPRQWASRLIFGDADAPRWRAALRP